MNRLLANRSGKRGAVLPYVIVVGVAILVLGAAIFTAANASAAMSRSSVAGRQAYLNAKSGIEYAKGVLAKRAQSTGTLPERFYAVGVVNDSGNAQFSATGVRPSSTDAPIFVEVRASFEGEGNWDIEMTSTGRGNVASLGSDDDIIQKLDFSTKMAITGGIAPSDGDGVNLGDLGAGTGFDPTIIANRGAPYSTANPTGGFILTPGTPPTEYSLLFQTPTLANQSGTLLNAEKLYFANKGTTPSLRVDSGVTASFTTDFIYVAGDLVVGQTASAKGKIVLNPKNRGATVVYFANGARLRYVNHSTGALSDVKSFTSPGGTMYSVAPGTDLVALLAGSSTPLLAGDTVFESNVLYFDATVRNLGTLGAPVLGSFVSGGTAGWVGPTDNMMSGGVPSSHVDKTICWYSTGGAGEEWASATTGKYEAWNTRLIWDNAGTWSIPSPSVEGQEPFTLATNLISLNIRGRSIAPADAQSKFILRTMSGAGDVAVFVARNTNIVQRTGSAVTFLPGWYSIKSGTDLFELSQGDYQFDAFVIDNKLFAAVVTNSGNAPLVFTATDGVRFDGSIVVPKNKQLTVKGTEFLFTDLEIDTGDQGNKKQTFILHTPTMSGNVIVTFSMNTTIRQSDKRTYIDFAKGTYYFPSGVDLINYELPNPPSHYLGEDAAPGAFEFTFSMGTYR